MTSDPPMVCLFSTSVFLLFCAMVIPRQNLTVRQQSSVLISHLTAAKIGIISKLVLNPVTHTPSVHTSGSRQDKVCLSRPMSNLSITGHSREIAWIKMAAISVILSPTIQPMLDK